MLTTATLAQDPTGPQSGVALWPMLVIVAIIAGLCLLILIAQMTDPRHRRETRLAPGKTPDGSLDDSDPEGDSAASAGAGPHVAAANVDQQDPPKEAERGDSQRGAD